MTAKTKTPILDETEPKPKGVFWVQVIFTGIGVVPFCALNCDSISDVMQLLHREDPNDQYFDALSEQKQCTRIYRHGVAAVTERTSSITAELIKGLKTH